MQASEVMNPLRDWDDFTRAYVECALWSSLAGEEHDNQPLDAFKSWTDIAHETLQSMMDDCAKFQADNAELIGSDYSKAGHDFWLTRNHHGAGFWDGDWPDDGAKLTDATQAFKEIELYIGDDGKIYA